MRVDVFFGPMLVTPADVQNRVVAVIDVLRASTSITAAIANGARCVIPLASSEEVANRARNLERSEVRLAGERKMQPIPGFDFGNSPGQFTRDNVEGKTVLMSTTNGTPTILAVQGARDILIASYVNFSPALAMLRTALKGDVDVVLVCAGNERHFALEDAACAGLFAQHLTAKFAKAEINDAAQAALALNKKFGTNLTRLLKASAHGKALVEAGYAADLPQCAELDAWAVLPVYQDRQITKLAADRTR